MKNYLIGLLIAGLAVLSSFYYKASQTPFLNGFPILEQAPSTSGGGPPFYLFIFMSRNNCHVCMEAIKVLNRLKPPFVTTGIIPQAELQQEEDFRRATGATFKLLPFGSAYKKFHPYYTPAIFGVAGSGKVLFVLPAVPEQKDYLYNFLLNFYAKSIELLIPLPEENP